MEYTEFLNEKMEDIPNFLNNPFQFLIIPTKTELICLLHHEHKTYNSIIWSFSMNILI